MTVRVLGLMRSCKGCPNRSTSGFQSECLLTGQRFILGEHIPPWCPLTIWPSEAMEELAEQNRRLSAIFSSQLGHSPALLFLKTVLVFKGIEVASDVVFYLWLDEVKKDFHFSSVKKIEISLTGDIEVLVDEGDVWRLTFYQNDSIKVSARFRESADWKEVVRVSKSASNAPE